MRAMPQLACGEIAEEIHADTIPFVPAEKNRRKSRRHHREVPACVQTFVDRRVVRQQGARISPTELHAAYMAWCAEQDTQPVTINKFGRSLTPFGFKKDSRYCLHIALKSQAPRSELSPTDAPGFDNGSCPQLVSIMRPVRTPAKQIVVNGVALRISYGLPYWHYHRSSGHG